MYENLSRKTIKLKYIWINAFLMLLYLIKSSSWCVKKKLMKSLIQVYLPNRVLKIYLSWLGSCSWQLFLSRRSMFMVRLVSPVRLNIPHLLQSDFSYTVPCNNNIQLFILSKYWLYLLSMVYNFPFVCSSSVRRFHFWYHFDILYMQ